MEKIAIWTVGILFYGWLSFYCFDSSNSDGNRAVAAMVICIFYIRHEFSHQEKRNEQLLERVLGMEQKVAGIKDPNPYEDD